MVEVDPDQFKDSDTATRTDSRQLFRDKIQTVIRRRGTENAENSDIVGGRQQTFRYLFSSSRTSMHSLFSRSRAASTPNKKANNSKSSGLDEFGRVASPASSHRHHTIAGPATPAKKDKKNKTKERSGTLPNHFTEPEEPAFPDGTILPLNLDPPKNDSATADNSKLHDYGYLSYERHVVLGIEQLERLVDVVSDELETRGGLTTPFIFTNSALDVSSAAVKRVIQAFIEACAARSPQEAEATDARWREEARFAGPHELGMCLRWGLARIVRSSAGHDVRGIISYEHYIEFRDSEAANRYPPAHFQTFLPSLPPMLQFVVVRLLSLLARLVANSTLSGHTPPSLSPLFGPLFFGLGPATLAFHHTYVHYLRSVNAFEHILLAFIRWQDCPRSTTASAASLGVPARLKEWIRGYPAMLPVTPSSKSNSKPQPRKGSRTVRVMSVRRNVRMYSPDLVKSASAWAQKNSSSNLHNSFAQSREWERIAPPTLKLNPRYSDSYKKKMNMPTNFNPDVHPGIFPGAPSPSAHEISPQLSLSLSQSTDTSEFGAMDSSADRFRSLTDLKWGEFESLGFSNLGDEKKLQFDLTESARQQRTAKRQTLSWNDFSAAGFTRTDAPLSATLQFSTPVVNTVTSWPTQQVDLNKKLKKSQKDLPVFGWDTEPIIGNEEVIEEAFIDVFCDLVYGGGWMDLERSESVDRDCNWALVEYKALPTGRMTTSGGSDPRTDTTLILYEEFVPLEYRQQLALPSKSRRRLPSLFSPSSKKQWKQAATLNGRPYVVGHVPQSSSFREAEFDALITGSAATKVISLSQRDTTQPQSTLPAPPSALAPIPPPPLRPPPIPVTLTKTRSTESTRSQARVADTAEHPPPPRSDEHSSDQSYSSTSGNHPMTPLSTKKSRFRLPVSPSVRRSMMAPPAEYSSVEFETRMASYSDEDHNGDAAEPEDAKQRRRRSRSDAWVDIVVGGTTPPAQGDPDMASQEVAQVLAAVKNKRSLSPTGYGSSDKHRHLHDSDVVEVDTVPRAKRLLEGGEDSVVLSAGRTSSSNEGAQDDVDDDEYMAPILNARQMAKEGRRLGYFDLHPERRTALGTRIDSQQEEEDPRERFARPSLSDDGANDTDEDVRLAYDQPDSRRPLPEPPAAPPATKPVVPEIKVIPNAAEPEGLTTPKAIPITNGRSSPSSPNRSPTGTGKTAALIEMYREKERAAAAAGKPVLSVTTVPIPVAPLNATPIPVAPLNVSRLPMPVRSASLPREQSAVPGSAADVTAPPLMHSLSNPLPTTTTVAPPDVLPTPAPLQNPGRVSPARYVHGAPLHNVLEEDEEED